MIVAFLLKNFIFFMTSNIGQSESTDEKDVDEKRENTLSQIKKNLKPELINRFSEIIVFKPLNKNSCLKITENELRMIIKKIFDNNGVKIILNKEVINFITDKGFNPEYNARPLKRAIEKYFEDSFSDLMLTKEVKKGDKFETLVSKEEKIIFEKN